MRSRAWSAACGTTSRRGAVRDLADEDIRYLFLDGWYPKVRIGRRRVRVPVLVTLGVRGTGERFLLDLRLAGNESAASWGEVVASLVGRHLRPP